MYSSPDIVEIDFPLDDGLICVSDLVFGEEGEVGDINDPADYGDIF